MGKNSDSKLKGFPIDFSNLYRSDAVYDWINEGLDIINNINNTMEGKEDIKKLEMDAHDELYRQGKKEDAEPVKKIRRFPSGAVRSDDTGRIRPDYISPYAEAEIAEHFTNNKNDFGPTNYFLGIEPVDIHPSMKRHMLELSEGIMKKDKALIRSALRSIGANSIMGLHQIVMEEKGEYVKTYESTELVNAEEYLKELEG